MSCRALIRFVSKIANWVHFVIVSEKTVVKLPVGNMNIIKTYIGALPAQRRLRIEELHALVLEVAPDANVSMKYKMPTYENAGNWLALASQKTYISVYTCCPDLIQPYLDEHPKTSHGKGCLRFRDSHPLDYAVMRQIFAAALLSDKEA